MLKRGRDCYDPHEGNIYTSEGGEVTTHNRYSPLVNCNDKMKEVLHNIKKPPDSSPDQDKKNLQSVYFKNYEEFITKNYDNFCFNKYMIDDYNFVMYTNKNNFCSGYFPEYISTLQSNNDAFKHSYPNDTFKYSYLDDTIDYSYPNYYPQFNNGKYSKQISNVNSRYNNSYFYKMQPIYKICKKFWKPFPSSERRTEGSEIRAWGKQHQNIQYNKGNDYSKPNLNSNYNYKPSSKHFIDRFSSNHSPCYERIAKGSERRTLGDHHYYYQHNDINNNHKCFKIKQNSRSELNHNIKNSKSLPRYSNINFTTKHPPYYRRGYSDGPNLKHSPCYEIIAKGSERRTL